MLCHVMFIRFRTTTSNIGFLFMTLERNGVKASNLQHYCTIILIVCMSVSSLILACRLVMEIGLRCKELKVSSG